MNEEVGQLVSRFVAERVDTPNPEEIEVWTQFVYAALFSVGFVVWLPMAKACSFEEERTAQLNRLIGEIVEDANAWIGAKICKALGSIHSNISIDSVAEIKFHLVAMFNEAILAMCERKFEPEIARSHACFVHLSANLEQLVLREQIAIEGLKHVLERGVASTDGMAKEAWTTLKRKQ